MGGAPRLPDAAPAVPKMTSVLQEICLLITMNPAVPRKLSTQIVTLVNEVPLQDERFYSPRSSHRMANIRLSFTSLESLSLFKITSLTCKEKGHLNRMKDIFSKHKFFCSHNEINETKAPLVVKSKQDSTPEPRPLQNALGLFPRERYGEQMGRSLICQSQ